jgi:hypothetical protein
MKHSWEEKLDARGVEFIEVVAKLSRVKQPTSLNADELHRWVKDEKEVLSSYPDLDNLGEKRKVDLDPKFIQLLLKTNPEWELSQSEVQRLFAQEDLPLLRAEQLEVHQRIALLLEADQDLRFQAYAAVAYAIVFLRRMFSSTLKKQFGTKKVNWFKMATAIAQHLRWVGNMFRGEIKPEPGRVNVELANLIDAICRFQKEPLTQLELYDAVKAAGGKVPADPEAFRLWLHRARKDGLVKNYRSSREDASDSSK